ncbi:protein kinase, putative [Leishmania tarentolae]|uniref:non-specific serine/threonine protein kinase n=1 Tax=Leishmania tarentolae TaxID=5689 RepID=A0A640KD16_LEITA|nr:protein kinase, putative [Leishmania tarentolae]
MCSPICEEDTLTRKRLETTMFDFTVSLNQDVGDSGCLHRHRRRRSSLGSSTSVTPLEEGDVNGVMQHLEAAAAAAAANSEGASGLTGCMCLGKSGKEFLCKYDGVASLYDDQEEDLIDGDAGESGSRTGSLSRERTGTDLLSVNSAGTSVRRMKDEVDLAAKGIPLEVRRFQCTKSILAFKEATKNDATAVPTNLVDFIVSLTSPKNGFCTEKEMCDWLVAQMCDRMETGQLWVIGKTFNLLFALLWRGSPNFIKSVHSNGASLFQVSHLIDMVRQTPQENASGECLPASLQPIEQRAAGRKSSRGRGKSTSIIGSDGTVTPLTSCFVEPLKHNEKRSSGVVSLLAQGSEALQVHTDPTLGVPESEISFFITNTAYMEALCEFRFRHPTVDLTRGKIMCDADDCSRSVSAGSAADSWSCRTTSATWKELLDDTLKLIRTIAMTDPNIFLCPACVVISTTRLRNAVLLYEVACRALVRLMHAVFTSLRTLVNAAQMESEVSSTTTQAICNEERPNAITGSDCSHISRFGNISAAVDLTFSPETVLGFVKMHYSAVYEFNSTICMLKTYCESTQHVSAEVAKKAAAALKLLPEDDFSAFRDTLKRLEGKGCAKTVDPSHTAPQPLPHQATNDSGVRALSADGAMEGPTTEMCTPLSTVAADEVSLPAPATSPTEGSADASSLPHAGVRDTLLMLYEFHIAHEGEHLPMWTRQVDAVCALFDEKEAAILHQIFHDGLGGLSNEWRDFTNNALAAAERALMTPCESTAPTAKRENSDVEGFLHSEGSAPESGGDRGSYGDAAVTHPAHSLCSRPSEWQRTQPTGFGSGDARMGLVAPSRSNAENGSISVAGAEKSAERSIEALLQAEDVVVICNEECSCNDTLKLIDRFQILMNVPLGQGSYGKVFRAWDEVTGCYLAAKELPLDSSKAHNVAVREVLQEYTVLTELSHPNIVRVVAFMVMKETARIYMEWMPSGSLQDVLRHLPRGVLRESVVRRYARDVVSGLAYLHSRGVIHRDVKPANMLLSSDGTVKLTDFGTSLVLSDNNRTLKSDALAGTAAYMAPECVQGTYSSASDIWSFGCSVVQLLTGHQPWYNAQTGSSPEPIALLFKIGCLDDTTHLERPHHTLVAALETVNTAPEASVSFDATVSNFNSAGTTDSFASTSSQSFRAALPTTTATPQLDISQELIHMLNAIFVVDRKKRPSARELMHHPFFK